MKPRCPSLPKGYVGAVCILLAMLESTYAASIIYVDGNAAGADSGTSWANAYNYLQDALAQANTSHRPVEIRVAQGVYRPDQGRSVGKGDRVAVLKMSDGISLIGGFAGVRGPDPDARDVEWYQSVLSGDLAGNDVWSDTTDIRPAKLPPTYLDNSACVVDASLTDRTAVLDGFTIEGAAYALTGDRPGRDWWAVLTVGGLYVNSGSPTVRHCLFTRNLAPGVVSAYARSAAFSGCQFAFNRFGNGAAIVNGLGDLVVWGCTFANNVAESGGAIWNTGGLVAIDGSAFRDNLAAQAGALHTSGGKVLLTQCEFHRNRAAALGPGMYTIGGALGSDGSPDVTISNCTFRDNTSPVHGGAVYAGGGKLTVKDCKFSTNRAEVDGGGISINRDVEASITGSVFVANRARIGAAVTCGGKGLVCERCIFAGNRAQDSAGGIYFAGAGVLVLNQCTTQGNVADQGSTITAGGHGVQVKGSIIWDPQAIHVSDPNRLLIVFSDLYEAHPGEGNISVDPLFARPGYWDPNGTAKEPGDDFWVEGDYHLKSRAGRWDPLSKNWVKDDVTSPCIDAGDPYSPRGAELYPGGRINMGAYGGTIEASKSDYGVQQK